MFIPSTTKARCTLNPIKANAKKIKTSYCDALNPTKEKKTSHCGSTSDALTRLYTSSRVFSSIRLMLKKYPFKFFVYFMFGFD